MRVYAHMAIKWTLRLSHVQGSTETGDGQRHAIVFDIHTFTTICPSLVYARTSLRTGILYVRIHVMHVCMCLEFLSFQARASNNHAQNYVPKHEPHMQYGTYAGRSAYPQAHSQRVLVISCMQKNHTVITHALVPPTHPPTHSQAHASHMQVFPYTIVDAETGRFNLPSREQLQSVKVVVTTCAGAALLAARVSTNVTCIQILFV
jgi:hypothetical protein